MITPPPHVPPKDVRVRTGGAANIDMIHLRRTRGGGCLSFNSSREGLLQRRSRRRQTNPAARGGGERQSSKDSLRRAVLGLSYCGRASRRASRAGLKGTQGRRVMGNNGLRGEYYSCAWFFNLGLQQKSTDCTWHVVGTRMAALLGHSRATHGPLHMPWTGCRGGHALVRVAGVVS